MQIAIIGGGQLAMMLCQSAAKYQYQTLVLDPNPNCSASSVCDQFICANYDDLAKLEQLASNADIVTYEFENISVVAIDHIDRLYNNVIQTSKPLRLSNDRLFEKQSAKVSGFSPVPFSKVSSLDCIKQFIKQVGYPVVLKTRSLGYDGKGQFIISDSDKLLDPQVLSIISSGAIVEQLIDLKYETSVIAIRNTSRQVKLLPSTINVHRDNILYSSTTIDQDLDPQIVDLVTNYLEFYDLVGIITIEVFVCCDGNIYFNELAPRPHNSGHFSIEGCNYSQYDMLLLALTGKELPEVKLVDKTMMVNVLGSDYERAKKFISLHPHPNLYFHDYYKVGVEPKRKMAHITAVGSAAISILNKYMSKENNE